MTQFDIRVTVHEPIYEFNQDTDEFTEIHLDDFHLNENELLELRETLKGILERMRFSIGEADTASDRVFSLTVSTIRSHD